MATAYCIQERYALNFMRLISVAGTDYENIVTINDDLPIYSTCVSCNCNVQLLSGALDPSYVPMSPLAATSSLYLAIGLYSHLAISLSL